jgi:hypothetical protein
MKHWYDSHGRAVAATSPSERCWIVQTLRKVNNECHVVHALTKWYVGSRLPDGLQKDAQRGKFEIVEVHIVRVP